MNEECKCFIVAPRECGERSRGSGISVNINCLIFPFGSFVALRLRFISWPATLRPDFHRLRGLDFRQNIPW
jgi:hypothetical protein